MCGLLSALLLSASVPEASALSVGRDVEGEPPASAPGPRVMIHQPTAGTSDRRVLVWGLDSDVVTPRYRHVAKTGITSIMKLLEGGIGSQRNETGRRKWYPYTAPTPAFEKRAGDFYIGSIRNPCDYYVSLWAYNAEHKAAPLRAELARGGVPDFFKTSGGRASRRDIDLFRGFARYIQGDVGVYTGRLAYGYVPAAVGLRANFSTRWLPHKTCVDVREKLAQFNTSKVDCWVSTESMAADVEACLATLSSKHGWRVNWEAYNKARATLRTNPSRHAPCRAYFDEGLERRVREKDGLVFQKFGFDKCCGAGSSLAAHLGGHVAA